MTDLFKPLRQSFAYKAGRYNLLKTNIRHFIGDIGSFMLEKVV